MRMWHNPPSLSFPTDAICKRYLTRKKKYLIGEKKKKTVKSDQLFSGEKDFSPTNNFTRLKLSPTKNFYQLFSLLNKNQITDTIKKLPIYYTEIWLSGVG